MMRLVGGIFIWIESGDGQGGREIFVFAIGRL